MVYCLYPYSSSVCTLTVPHVSLYGVFPYLGQLNGLLFVLLLFAPLPGTVEWFTVCTLAVPHVSLYGVFPY